MRYGEWLSNFFMKWNRIYFGGHGHAVPLDDYVATPLPPNISHSDATERVTKKKKKVTKMKSLTKPLFS